MNREGNSVHALLSTNPGSIIHTSYDPVRIIRYDHLYGIRDQNKVDQIQGKCSKFCIISPLPQKTLLKRSPLVLNLNYKCSWLPAATPHSFFLCHIR